MVTFNRIGIYALADKLRWGGGSGQWGGASCPTVGQFLRSYSLCDELITWWRCNCQHVNPNRRSNGRNFGLDEAKYRKRERNIKLHPISLATEYVLKWLPVWWIGASHKASGMHAVCVASLDIEYHTEAFPSISQSVYEDCGIVQYTGSH
jgi:hypothetical protein